MGEPLILASASPIRNKSYLCGNSVMRFLRPISVPKRPRLLELSAGIASRKEGFNSFPTFSAVIFLFSGCRGSSTSAFCAFAASSPLDQPSLRSMTV
jgi:hypothetical protein